MSMSVVWDTSSKENRRKLLKASGFHESFADVEKFDDLPKHSGGMVYRRLNDLFNIGRKKGRF